MSPRWIWNAEEGKFITSEMYNILEAARRKERNKIAMVVYVRRESDETDGSDDSIISNDSAIEDRSAARKPVHELGCVNTWIR